MTAHWDDIGIEPTDRAEVRDVWEVGRFTFSSFLIILTYTQFIWTHNDISSYMYVFLMPYQHRTLPATFEEKLTADVDPRACKLYVLTIIK